MKKILITAMALAAACSWAAPDAKGGAKSAANAKNDPAQIETRARRVIKNALTLIEQKEDERAVGMLEAVGRMYPDSQARFEANLELGRHFLGKRDFDRAGLELRRAQAATNVLVQAEAIFLQGKTMNVRGKPGEALMILRRLTQDYPTCKFANDAYFLIGEIHFDAHRWARAAEAFRMVGTAVPVPATNETVLAEAGQRIYVHVNDKDLTVLAQLGVTTDVEVVSASGDKEKAVLAPFGRGDGDFITSVRTTTDPSKPYDGVLTVTGADQVHITYIDRNAEDGKPHELKADSQVVSSGSIAFMDGALRQRVRGLYIGQPAIIRLRDLDLDKTDQPDKVKATIRVQYKERPEPLPGAKPDDPPPPPAPDAPWLTRGETEIELVETAPRSGIFLGRVTPQIIPTNETAKVGEVAVQNEDRLVACYMDELYLDGHKPTERWGDAIVIVGGSTEPQSIIAHANEAATQAKKLLLEAKLLYQWGSIFKDVGLQANADGKANDGLARVEEIMNLLKRNSLDRIVVEETYEVMWNLYLVKNDLNAAIQTCQALVRLYPDTLLADRAFMQIANANRMRDDKESHARAITIYGSIIAMASSQLKAEAQFHIGEILEADARQAAAARQLESKGEVVKPDFSQAMAAFKRCADNYPNSSYAGESFKRVIDYYISVKDHARAQETLERVFLDYPDAPWLDEMLLKWGVVLHRLGNTELAKEKFRRILEEYPGGASAKQAADFIRKIEDQESDE